MVSPPGRRALMGGRPSPGEASAPRLEAPTGRNLRRMIARARLRTLGHVLSTAPVVVSALILQLGMAGLEMAVHECPHHRTMAMGGPGAGHGTAHAVDMARLEHGAGPVR